MYIFLFLKKNEIYIFFVKQKHSDYQNKEIKWRWRIKKQELNFQTLEKIRQWLSLNRKLDQDFLEAIVKGKEKKDKNQ